MAMPEVSQVVDGAGSNHRVVEVRDDDLGSAAGDLADRPSRSGGVGSRRDPGCDWHTAMDAVMVFGEVLINDPARYPTVNALGLDETLCQQLRCWGRSPEF